MASLGRKHDNAACYNFNALLYKLFKMLSEYRTFSYFKVKQHQTKIAFQVN